MNNFDVVGEEERKTVMNISEDITDGHQEEQRTQKAAADCTGQ